VQNGEDEESSGFGYAFRQFLSGEDRMFIRAESVTAQDESLQIELPYWMQMDEPIKIRVDAGSFERLNAFMRNWHGESFEVSTEAVHKCPFD
jgi:hypothetical protein